MRKSAGLGAFTKSTQRTTQYATHGRTLQSAHLSSLQTQLSVFREALLAFSAQHAHDIRSNPSFRSEFARLCTSIGIDPLAATSSSSSAPKSSWAQFLGLDTSAVGDYYFNLAVRVVELCRATRAHNGGLLALSDICERVGDVAEADVRKAVEVLEPLEGGLKVLWVAGRECVRSVPKEFSGDVLRVLEVLAVVGWVSDGLLRDNLGWEKERVGAVVEDMVGDGLVWVDMQGEGEWMYWAVSWGKI